MKKSLLWLLNAALVTAIFLTACEPTTNPSGTEKNYPETITVTEKKAIDSSLSNADKTDFEELMEMFSDISSLLKKHSDEAAVAEYSTNLESIISELNSGNFKTLDSLISKVEYANLTSYTKEQNDNYKNYSDYENLFNLYNEVCDNYSSFYNGEYSEKYNAYKTKYDELSQNPEKYNELTEFMRNVVKDFKDNYIFDNTFTSKQAKDLVKAVETEQSSIDSYVNDLSNTTDVLNAYLKNVNTVDSELSSFNLEKDSNENPGEDPENPGEDPENTIDRTSNPLTKFTEEDFYGLSFRYDDMDYLTTASYYALKNEFKVISSVLGNYPKDETAVKYKKMLDSIYEILNRIDTDNFVTYQLEEKITIIEYPELDMIYDWEKEYSNYDEYRKAYEEYSENIEKLFSAKNDYEDYYNRTSNALDTIQTYNSLVTEYARNIIIDFAAHFNFSSEYDEKLIETYVSNIEKADEEFNQKYDTSLLFDIFNAYEESYKKVFYFSFTFAEKTKTVYMGTTGLTASDLSGFAIINIAVPDNSTEIDVVSLYNTKLAVEDIVYDFDRFPEVNFASYPETVTKFNFTLPENVGNKEFLTQINNPRLSKIENIGDKITVEMIPGVEVIATRLYASGDENIYRNIKFTKQNNITSVDIDLSKTSSYDLTQMKDTGIEVSSDLQFEIKNLGNTTITGELRNDSNLSKFEEMFLHNYSSDINGSELPILDNLKFYDLNTSNAYGTNIDKVISFYFNKNAENKLSVVATNSIFNAVNYLNGEYMYDNDNTFNNAYEIDMNTFMYLINNIGSVSNVKVTGNNYTGEKKDLSNTGSIANIRFENDLTGMDFTSNAIYGIIDFAGKAPSKLKNSHGKTILRAGSVDNGIEIDNIGYLDLTELDYTKDFSKLNFTDVNPVEIIYYNSNEASKASLNTLINAKVVDDNIVYGSTSTVLKNIQFEKAGRDFNYYVRYYTVSKLDS